MDFVIYFRNSCKVADIDFSGAYASATQQKITSSVGVETFFLRQKHLPGHRYQDTLQLCSITPNARISYYTWPASSDTAKYMVDAGEQTTIRSD